MSLHRVLLAAIALTSVGAGLTLAPAPASAQYDFTCHPAREHCPAAVRDNYTIFVDTDGSMNAESDRNICCGGGDDSYWLVAREEIEDFADRNDNSGSCDSDAGSCKSKGCDGVRVGIGFFGDDSDVDSGDGILAYVAETAGEGKRSDVKSEVNSESAGNDGLPGIETLACPPNGTGQSDTIQCPDMGTNQESRIHCPPNGGVQIDAIGCPFDGAAQTHRLRCPEDAVQQQIDVTVTNFFAGFAYNITVDGLTRTVFAPPIGSTFTIASQFRTLLAGDPVIGSTYTVTQLGPTVRLTHNTPGAEGVVMPGVFMSGPVENPADPKGLPDLPAVGTDYDLQIDGTNIRYTSVAGDLSQDICQGVADDINATVSYVTATATAGVLEITADLPGDDFTVTNPMNLNYMGSTGHLDGVPGKPAAPKTFEFDIDGDTYSYTHAGAGETALNICDQLIADVNADTSLDVTASRFDFGFDVHGRPDYRIHLTSDVAGQDFTVTVSDPDLRSTGPGLGTIQANGAGLPGDPGAGHVYDFMLNSSLIQATGTTTSTTASVCTDLYNAVIASGEPVNVANFGTFIRITHGTLGVPFTISSPDFELMHDPFLPGSAGLPGTPGAAHSYDWTWTDYDGNSTTISVPSPPAPTTTNVCQAIRDHLNAMPEFSASLNATMDEVTVTGTPGLTWTFSGFDSYLSPHTETLTGALPNNPGIYNTYDFRINGDDIDWTDDGTPTQAEVCAGVTARINAVSGDVTATHDGSTITIEGNDASAFDITSVESDLSPHVVVREAGLGPSAYGELATRINDDLNITTRNQNAIAITHRGPEDYTDFSLAVDQLCAARDDMSAPVTTYFIGMDIDSTEKNLLDILAAAGGSGSCSGGVDPCAVASSTLVNSVTMTPVANCNGAYSVSEWGLDNALEAIKDPMSCTFELDVPPTYPDGSAPGNTDLTRVYINKWEGRCNDTIRVAYDRSSGPNDMWNYFWDLDDCDGWSFAVNYYQDGWQWEDSTVRKHITFDDEVCEEIQEGDVIEIETHVGCACTNQGDECTAPFVTTDPMTGATTPIPCKSPTHGRCENPGGMDPAICVGGTATGECSDDAYCLQTCTAEQLAVMRCATGVYLCDEDTGAETCTAGSDNIVPEICNGVDDDCDGLVDNMSNNADDAFAGFDTLGRDCNGRDACICADGFKDISSDDPTDLQAHLDTFSGGCECGEALGAPEPAMSMEVAEREDAPSETAPIGGDANAACAVVDGEGRGDFTLLGLLGLLFFGRRRRRRA